MNKTSNYAFQIAQDIYQIASKVDELFEQYDNHQIGVGVFTKKIFTCVCEAHYLEEVVKAMKNNGYKFAKYEKELLLLESLSTQIPEHLNLESIENTTEFDTKALTKLTEKYKDVVSVEDITAEIEGSL